MPTLTALTALLSGVLAGLGVAVPPGAVAVLLLREALTRGRAHGVAAGLGIATTDAGYALVAVLAGAAVAGPIAAHATGLRVLAGSVLAGIALLGIARTRHAGQPSDVAEVPGPAGSTWRTWARFAGVTLVNPTTALAFTVLVVAIGERWDGAAERVAFVLGVGVGSLGWHVLLALLAARAGDRLDPRRRARLGLVGHGLVLALAVWVVLRA